MVYVKDNQTMPQGMVLQSTAQQDGQAGAVGSAAPVPQSTAHQACQTVPPVLQSTVLQSTGPEVFTMERANTLRRTTQGVHNQMRDLLNRLTADAEQAPTTVDPNEPRREELPPLTPWRHYLAHHKQASDIIGPGVVTMYAQFRSRPDANRESQLRLDFVVERSDGKMATLHPGRNPRSDAKVQFFEPGEFRP